MRKVVIIVVLAFTVICANAQYRTDERAHKASPERMAEIQSKRIAFFSSKMSLTPAEAEKFWPIYNEFTNKKMDIERRKHELFNSFRASDTTSLSDKQAQKLSSAYVKLGMEQAILSQTYYEQYKSILSPQKIVKLYQAEHQFTRELIRMIKKGHEPPAPGDGFPPDEK